MPFRNEENSRTSGPLHRVCKSDIHLMCDPLAIFIARTLPLEALF